MDALVHLPPKVARDLMDQKKLTRELSPEERNEFEELCRKYDHLGGG